MTGFPGLVGAGGVRVGVPASSKKALFAQIGSAAHATLAIDADAVADALAAREKLGSTGFGGGVAIPHGRLSGLSGIAGLIFRLAQPLEFRAVDDQPVDLVFAMLSPPDAGADHLKALAQVSRRLRDPGFVAKLRGAGSPDALYALWIADGQRDG